MVLAHFSGDGFLDAALAGPTTTNLAVLTDLGASAPPHFDGTASAYSGGKFRGRLLCAFGQKQVIECSSNFVNWVAVATNSAGVTPFYFTNTTTSEQGFYRARVLP